MFSTFAALSCRFRQRLCFMWRALRRFAVSPTTLRGLSWENDYHSQHDILYDFRSIALASLPYCSSAVRFPPGPTSIGTRQQRYESTDEFPNVFVEKRRDPFQIHVWGHATEIKNKRLREAPCPPRLLLSVGLVTYPLSNLRDVAVTQRLLTSVFLFVLPRPSYPEMYKASMRPLSGDFRNRAFVVIDAGCHAHQSYLSPSLGN